jgi:acylphosphatase
MIAKKVLISGLVQGVGFRYWACQRAESLGLAGWVRNRRNGSVEALVYGETDAVEEFVRACRLGPRHCRVTAIFEELAEPPVEPGFLYKPTF